jgi:hypothetical protein
VFGGVNLNNRKFLVEFICAFFLGIIPSLFLLLTDGVQGMLGFARQVVTDWLFYYYAAIGFILFLFLKLAKQQSASTAFSYNLVRIIRSVHKRVGTSVLGLYRTVAGCIFIMLAPLPFIEPSLFSVALLMALYLFAFVILVICSKVEDCFAKL